MAYAEIFATLAEVQHKVGANASTTSNAAAYVTDFMFQAESYINVATNFNWSDAYSGLNDDFKGILKEAASNLAAIYVLNYDYATLTAATSRIEMEDRLNLLWARFNACMKVLTTTGATKFIQGL